MPVIDAAVARVLRAKFELGLFEHPYVDRRRRRVLERPRRPSRARARGGARVDRAAEERARHAAAGEDDQARSPSSAPTPSRRGSAATAGPASSRSSILDGIKQQAAGLGERDAICPGPGRVDPRVRHRAAGAARVDRSGRAGRGLHGEYFDNNRLEGAPRLTRIDAAHRLPLDAQLARTRHSVRLVLRPLDRIARRARRAACGGSASKATTAIASTSTTSSSSTTGRSSRTARGSPTSHGAPGSAHRHPARVLREHRQRAAEADLGRRRAPTTARARIDERVALARRSDVAHRRRRRRGRRVPRPRDSRACRAGRRS